MLTQMHYVFGKNINTSGILSNVFYNNIADVLSLEVAGDFEGEIVLEGKIDKDLDEYVMISGINLTNFEITNTIKNKCIVEYGIEGLQYIRVNIKSLTSGSVNIIGRIINTAE